MTGPTTPALAGPVIPTSTSARPWDRHGKPPHRADLPGLARTGTPLLGLARGGACPARAVTRPAVRSYRTFSPLPVPHALALVSWSSRAQWCRHAHPISRYIVTCTGLNSQGRGRGAIGGVFSVALSLTARAPRRPPRRRVGVTHHRVLSCSDFPPVPLLVFSVAPRRPHGRAMTEHTSSETGGRRIHAMDLLYRHVPRAAWVEPGQLWHALGDRFRRPARVAR